jgi:hypothetical protein
MDARVRAFGEALATTAIARDWTGVHGLLAPWLHGRFEPGAVRAFFEDDYRATLKECGVAEMLYPMEPYVSGNSSTLAELREVPSFLPGPRPIPAEVTEANFRQWMKVQLLCSGEQADQLDVDYLTEIWLVVVELDGELRVGYWSHDPYECERPGPPR